MIGKTQFSIDPIFFSYSFALVSFFFVKFLMHWHLTEKFRVRQQHQIKDSTENFVMQVRMAADKTSANRSGRDNDENLRWPIKLKKIGLLMM